MGFAFYKGRTLHFYRQVIRPMIYYLLGRKWYG